MADFVDYQEEEIQIEVSHALLIARKSNRRRLLKLYTSSLLKLTRGRSSVEFGSTLSLEISKSF
jgi:hypothetical protein